MPRESLNPNIDLGLSVLCAMSIPGDSLTQSEIAHVCDCSRDAIYKIEKRALKKARSKALVLGLQIFLES